MYKPVLGMLLLPLALAANAQELSLFEATETDANQAPTLMQQVGSLNTNNNGQPAFTLKGLGRFGNEYHATLLGRNGESARVNWREGQRVQVPGFPNFALVGVVAGAVQVAFPPNEPCMSLETSGISCLADNVAQIQVATAAPLASNGTPPNNAGNNAPGNIPPGAQQGGAVMGPDAAGPGFFVNPFSGEMHALPDATAEQQAMVERQQQRAARLRDVEPVRIDEADVPPGMQVVRTPFGDRLVPVRE
jgi:hypothetical protein